MATYLDRLSMLTNEDDDSDKILNEYLELLNQLLFSYTPYVILVMNWKQLGQFDAKSARQCILHIWHGCNGVADMQTCCRVFCESLDDLVSLQDQVVPIVQDLIAKYQDR